MEITTRNEKKYHIKKDFGGFTYVHAEREDNGNYVALTLAHCTDKATMGIHMDTLVFFRDALTQLIDTMEEE